MLISAHFTESSLNYCYYLFCIGVSGAIQILCQDHMDVQSKLRKLKVLQQSISKSVKESESAFYINMSFFLALKSEMQKLQETEIQRRELHSRMEVMQKQFEMEKLQVLLSF